MTSQSAPLTVYTIKEAAEILRVRPSWLERQAAARRVPFTMLGGSYRFTTEHLQRIVRIFEKANSEATEERSPRRRRRDACPPAMAVGVTPLRPRPRQES